MRVLMLMCHLGRCESIIVLRQKRATELLEGNVVMLLVKAVW